MNTRELIKKVRVKIDEAVHSVNGNDSMISDETILDCANAGIVKFEQITAMNTISNEDIQFNIELIANQDLYKIDDKIRQLSLPVIFDGNIKLKLKKCSADDINSNTIHGRPILYSLDYKPGYIKLAPIPNKEYNLSYMAVIKSNRLSLNNLNQELPFNEDYHLGIVFYASYLCLTQIGNDNSLVKQYLPLYEKMWNDIYLDAKRDQQNKYFNIDSLYFKNIDYPT